MGGEMATGQVDVLRRDPEPAPVALAHAGRHVVEIGPSSSRRSTPAARRRRHWRHRSRAASAAPRRHRIRDLLADEILAGHAEMHLSGGQLRHDLGGGEIGDLDNGQPGDAAAIPRAPRGDCTRSSPARSKKACVFSCTVPSTDGDDERLRTGADGLMRLLPLPRGRGRPRSTPRRRAHRARPPAGA